MSVSHRTNGVRPLITTRSSRRVSGCPGSGARAKQNEMRAGDSRTPQKRGRLEAEIILWRFGGLSH